MKKPTKASPKTTKSKRPLEGEYCRTLLKLLDGRFERFRFFRRNTGMVQVGNRMFRAGVKGQSDIYVIGYGGLHGEIEVKRFAPLSFEQCTWLDWCEENRVPHLVLSAVESEILRETVDRWLREVESWLLEMTK